VLDLGGTEVVKTENSGPEKCFGRSNRELYYKTHRPVTYKQSGQKFEKIAQFSEMWPKL
jgi:hypothetical protein